MSFPAALSSRVANRGTPRPAFIDELVSFGRSVRASAPEIFAPNTVPLDIFTVIKSALADFWKPDGAGTPIYHWVSLDHRLGALMEAMRVHAGLESSWKFGEGVDITNNTSMRNISGQETGIFQVSFNSLNLGGGALIPFARVHGIDRVEKFIPIMKSNHALALEYYARLVRVSIRWAGPLIRNSGEDRVVRWLNRAAMNEFIAALA